MENILSILQGSGIMYDTDVEELLRMTHKKQVLKQHKSKISQGGGRDKRWFTRAVDPLTGESKKILAQTEDELYEKLYQIYFNPKVKSIRQLYPEWIQYKYKVSTRSNNVHRIDTDYKKYYLDEPLSQEILDKPITDITAYDIKLWSAQLVKKHNMTKKKFGNAMVVMRQIMDMMIDKDIMARNPARLVKFDNGMFAAPRIKPKASSQIFYADELEMILNRVDERARETCDEAFLAIPLMMYTGARPGECMAFEFDDFDRENNRVTICKSFVVEEKLLEDGTWTTREYKVADYLKKNAPPREIQVPDKCFEVVDQIRRILKSKGITRKNLFSVQTHNNIGLKLYYICDDLGIERRSPNKLRKTYVSNLLNDRFDPDFVRTQAGHTNIQTTLNNYTFSTTRDEELIKRLNACIG